MTKIEDLIRLLRTDWVTAGELCRRFGWQSHTLRGALSIYGRKHSIKIERRRLNKITSYRIAEEEAEPTQVVATETPLPNGPTVPDDLSIPEFLRRDQ